MKRVVITGAGTINAIGASVAETFASMRDGRCGIGPLAFRDVERLSVQIGAQIQDYNEQARFTRSELAAYDRFTQYALIAAEEATAQAGITGEAFDPVRAGVILGTSGGGLMTQDENFRAVYEAGKNRVPPLTVARLMQNAACSHLSMHYAMKGPVMSVSTACASSNHAMGQAFQLIRSGGADVVLTGGSEAMLCFGGVKVWEGLRVMSPDGCRPFSANRNGMVQGEGAAIYVFEEREHALARGAKILAEVSGFGQTADAGELVSPDPDGAARAMQEALSVADLSPEDIGYINAHGTATRANDVSETKAIRTVFGASADDVRVSSTKAMHGHVIGGTGAIELLALIMALQEGVLAPNINYDAPDPECDLNIIANTAANAQVDHAMSNAFAFGGLNAVLVLSKA